MWVSLTAVSSNRKVGPIPVSTTEKSSCPKSCPLKDTDCYARLGPLGIHWAKVGNGRGDNWSAFCNRVSKFITGQLWRHNQAGDLPRDNDLSTDIDRIDQSKCDELSEASKHTKGWTYTHYDVTDDHNKRVVEKMNSIPGMTVNLSADSIQQAENLYNLGIGPVCVTLPNDIPVNGNKTPSGVAIVICPAQTQDNISCSQCKLCQVKTRKSIVGFLAHGVSAKRLSNKLKETNIARN